MSQRKRRHQSALRELQSRLLAAYRETVREGVSLRQKVRDGARFAVALTEEDVDGLPASEVADYLFREASAAAALMVRVGVLAARVARDGLFQGDVRLNELVVGEAEDFPHLDYAENGHNLLGKVVLESKEQSARFEEAAKVAAALKAAREAPEG
jgi:hypothetical protein